MAIEFLAKFVEIFFDVLSFAILARVIISWLAMGGSNRGGRIQMVLHDVTEPVLGPFRKVIPRLGMIDISPLIALIVLDLVKVMLISIILSLSASI